MHTTQHDETYTSRHKPSTETLSVQTGGGGGTDERETLTGWSRFIVHGRQDTYTHTWTDHTQRTQGIKHTCWHTLIYTVTHTLTRARTHFKRLDWPGSLLPSPPSSWPLTSISSSSRLAVSTPSPSSLSLFHLFLHLFFSPSAWFHSDLHFHLISTL